MSENIGLVDTAMQPNIREQTEAWNAYATAKCELDQSYSYERRERARIAFNRFTSKFLHGERHIFEIASDSKWGMPE